MISNQSQIPDRSACQETLPLIFARCSRQAGSLTRYRSVTNCQVSWVYTRVIGSNTAPSCTFRRMHLHALPKGQRWRQGGAVIVSLHIWVLFERDVATRLSYIMQPALPGDLNYIFFCSSHARRLRLPTVEAPIHSAHQRERINVVAIQRIAFSLSSSINRRHNDFEIADRNSTWHIFKFRYRELHARLRQSHSKSKLQFFFAGWNA